MSTRDPDEHEHDTTSPVCPYCWNAHPDARHERRWYVHPIRFQPPGGLPHRLFHRVVLSNNGLPDGAEQQEMDCPACQGRYYVVTLPDQSHQESRAAPRNESNDRLVFERLIDYCHRHIVGIITIFCVVAALYGLVEIRFGDPSTILPVSNDVLGASIVVASLLLLVLSRATAGRLQDVVARSLDHAHFSLPARFLLNAILVGVTWLTFLALPSIITGSIDKFPEDKPILLTPFILIGLLTVFHYQLHVVRKSFLNVDSDLEKLPINWHANFRKADYYDTFRKNSIRRFFFGKNSDRFFDYCTPSVFFGLMGIIIGMFYFVYFLPKDPGTAFYDFHFTVYEVIRPDSNPLVYTSGPFNLGWLIFYIPFWVTIGTLVWLSLISPYFIARISGNFPLKIDYIQDFEKTKIFGDMLLKSNTSILLLALVMMAYLIWEYQTPPYTTILLMSLFPLAIFFGFFYPLIPIHAQMKLRKETEIERLMTQIDYANLKSGALTHEEVQYTALRLEVIRTISSTQNWPIRFDVWLRIVSFILIPITTIILNINGIIAMSPFG